MGGGTESPLRLGTFVVGTEQKRKETELRCLTQVGIGYRSQICAVIARCLQVEFTSGGVRVAVCTHFIMGNFQLCGHGGKGIGKGDGK